MFFLIAAATLFLVLLCQLLLGGALQTYFPGLYGIAVMELLYGLIALLGGCAMVVAARKSRGVGDASAIDLYEIFSTRAPRARHVLAGILLIAVTYLLGALYTNIAYRLFPDFVSRTAEAARRLYYAENLPAMILAVGVFPAVCEELVFRGVTQYALSRHAPARVAVFMTALLFGLFHLDPVRIPIAFLTGLALSYALLRSRSILIPALMHFLNNAVSALIASRPTVPGMEEVPVMTPLEVIVGGVQIGGICLLLLFGALALFEGHPIASVKKHRITATVLAGVTVLLTAGFVWAQL